MFGADLFILSAIPAYKGGTIYPTGPCTGQEARGGGSIQSIDWGAYNLPEKVGEELYWPETETFCENLNKRKIYFYPHCYVPKLLFSLRPVAALRAAVYYIFKLVFGADNEHQAKSGLSKINIRLLGPFQTFFGMVLDIWQLGYPKTIPASL